MPFETPFDPTVFDVTFTTHHIDVGGPAPKTIIRTDQEWTIHLVWRTTGSATAMIGGKWHVHAYLESMGPGNDFSLIDPNDHHIDLRPGDSPIDYPVELDVPAGVVHFDPGIMDNTGIYKLVVAVTYEDLIGNPGPIAGNWVGPMLQFFLPT